VQEVPPGPPDQVTRLERYRQEHPDVDIQPPGAQSAVWRAFRDGELIAYGFTLMVFMERLEALPEPLGLVRDFDLHHLAMRPSPDCRESNYAASARYSPRVLFGWWRWADAAHRPTSRSATAVIVG